MLLYCRLYIKGRDIKINSLGTRQYGCLNFDTNALDALKLETVTSFLKLSTEPLTINIFHYCGLKLTSSYTETRWTETICLTFMVFDN